MVAPLISDDEERITGNAPMGLTTLSYVLTFSEVPNGAGTILQFQLLAPQGWHAAADSALSMRVPGAPKDPDFPGGCRLKITLDSNFEWHFRKGPDLTDIKQNPITVSKPRTGQYLNLAFDNGDDQTISFDAVYSSAAPTGTTDHFNLYVNLDQQMGNNPQQVPIRIDPDIINPGNHP